MKWAMPPKIKIYEALGCIADNRILKEDNKIRCYSSSKNKFYIIQYSEEQNAIMTNDNASYYKGYLGYPAIAYLMHINKITYNQKFANALKGIKWKDLNQKFKNNFSKTEDYIKKSIVLQGTNIKEFDAELNSILTQIKRLNLNLLGIKTIPPKGY